MSHPPSARQRGGQPGNINRLTHGLYSRRVSPPTDYQPSSPAESPEPGFQLALARRRLAQLLDRQQSASPSDWLTYERGIMHYLSLISSLWWKNARPTHGGTIGLGRHDGHPYIGMLESLRLADLDASGDSREDLFPIRTSDGTS